MFWEATKQVSGKTFLYLNSDILLDDSAGQVLAAIQEMEPPWLGSARRWCVPQWSGEPPGSEAEWKNFFARARREGRWGQACALDIFLFRGLCLKEMPAFLIGHRGWDNWMIFHARTQGVPIIDLSHELNVIHCDHNYCYAEKNSDPSRRDGPLEEINLNLLGGEERLFHLGHATHELRDGEVRPRRGWSIRQRNLELWQILHPGQRWWWQPLRSLFHPLLKSWQAATTREESWSSRAGHGASR